MADWPAEWSEPASEEDKERWRSTTIGDRAPGGRAPSSGYVPRPIQQPVWEKGKVYENRPGGFRVPMVHAATPSEPVTVKQYQNNRGGFDKQRDRLKNDPTIFKD